MYYKLCSTCQQPSTSCSCTKSSTDNVTYTGPTLPCTGIQTNDTLTSIIQQLNALHCTTTTTSSSSTSTTFVPFPGELIPVLRAASPCRGDPTEVYIDVTNMDLSNPVFTGTDGRAYSIISSHPIYGSPSVFQSLTNTNQYTNCTQWNAANGPCPTTTTSTTPVVCVTYEYTVKGYNCYTCQEIDTWNIRNLTQLTVGRFYNDPVEQTVYQILNFVGCHAGPANTFLQDADQKNNCAFAQCPATTTTTTTCTVYKYQGLRFNCGTCNNAVGINIFNDSPLPTNKCWFNPVYNKVECTTGFWGCDNGPYSSQFLAANGVDYCSLIPCPSTTTTTTTCPAYNYQSTAYTCFGCAAEPGPSLTNAYPLALGLYYYNELDNLVYHITGYFGCSSAEFINGYIPSGTGIASCGAVPCPTPCKSYTYRFNVYSCGTCNAFISNGILNNAFPLTVGQFYHTTEFGGGIFEPTQYLGCTGMAPDTYIPNVNGEATCVLQTCVLPPAIVLSDSESGSANACLLDTYPNVVYSTGFYGINVGDKLYTDPGMLIEFFGGDLWYNCPSVGRSLFVINDGGITGDFSCS